MIARIRTGKSIKGAINYNENKVKQGQAILIEASGYSKDANQLNFHEKYQRLQRLADLNTRATTNCLHVSLNFDPSEQLSTATLQQIAKKYMQEIGFGKQPYLVYEHHDAAHQHIHIVSTNIQKDGLRISLHNLGKLQSENARKAIEVQFGLVKAGSKQQKDHQQFTPVNPGKVQYGKQATKQAISNVITHVISQYKFASLHELNAVLKLFNVMADRGAEGTRMFEKKGLQYALIDAAGKKIGVPIKASSIKGKPTLANLEKRYAANKQAGKSLMHSTRRKIDEALSYAKDLNTFQRYLQQKNIDLILRINDEKILYGITYVDHNNKAVFNGSALGKQYSAAAIREMIGVHATVSQKEQYTTKGPGEVIADHHQTKQENDLLQILAGAEKAINYLPYGLKRRKRKKKRKPEF